MDRADVRQRAQTAALRAAATASRRLGYDLVESGFYNPLPDVGNLPESLWAGPRETLGVDLRIEEAARLLEELRPYVTEFSPPLEAPGPEGGFFIRNGTYESVDAEVLYGIVRHAKPQRVVELGSGSSSHVIHAARRAAAADGAGFEHVIYDPFPFTANPMGPITGATVHTQRTEDLDAAALCATLQASDVLFVDTTHTVKTGGDVTKIVLDVLPRLVPGVWVHVHDIFLPYEYPREWVVEQRRAWAEQYLLQAFLAFNDRFEVALPNYALSRARPDVVAGVVPSFAPGVSPGGFWLRSVAPS